MLKLLGIMLILLGSLSAGYYPLYLLEEKSRYHQIISSLLMKMAAELRIGAPPIPTLIDRLQESKEFSSLMFIEEVSENLIQLGSACFCECWEISVHKHCEIIDWDLKEKLIALGGYLGRYSLEDEIQALEHLSNAFSQEHIRLKTYRRELNRVVIGSSLSVGTMLAIILL